MINRIEKEINNILQWKQRFENLVKRGVFSAQVLESRAFKREQLKQYDQLLVHHPLKKLNPEEKIYRKLAAQQSRQLERELYPQNTVRLFRNLFRLGTAVGRGVIGAFKSSGMSSRQSARLSHSLTKSGFGELKPELTRKRDPHQPLSTKVVSESIAPGQRVDYELHFPEPGRKTFSEMNGFKATLHSDRSEPLSINVEAASGITKAQAMQLLQGRAINTRKDVWTVPDLNDRDAEGHIRIREIKIPDFNPRTALETLPISFNSETQKRDMLNDLQDGKRVLSEWKIDGKKKTIGLELNPLRRGITLFEGNRKTSLEKLYGKVPWEEKDQNRQVHQPKIKDKARVVKMH